jgi:integrase
MQSENLPPGGPPARQHLNLFNPDGPPRADAALPAESTVREIVDRYLAHSEKVGTHGAESAVERRRVLLRFCAATLPDGRAFGDCPVSAMLPHHLSDWIEDQPRWKSSSTRKSKANQVNAAFNWAAGPKQRRIEANPFEGVDYEEAPPRPCLPDAVFAKVADAASKPFEEAMEFLDLTGCRLSDLFRLDWPFIDWVKGQVKLEKHKSRKKTGKAKIFALVPEAIELLKRIRERNPASSGPVFLNTRGRRWNRGTLGQNIRRIKKRLGIAEKATLHGIRHMFGRQAIKNGAPVKLISKQLGHSSVTTTERYYCDLDDEIDAIRDAAKLAGKRPDKPPDGKEPTQSG